MKLSTLVGIYSDYLDSIGMYRKVSTYGMVDCVVMITSKCKRKRDAWNAFYEDDGGEGNQLKNPY